MISEDKKYQCWLSDGDRILSFHPVSKSYGIPAHSYTAGAHFAQIEKLI